ncbi:MAG: GTPase Era [Nitrosomonas sp.]|nr:GTPase Era [Nitrosomonas sp.]
MLANMHFHTGYIAIVGRPNVGKSTLLNNLIQQKISITSRKAQTTRHSINGILTDQHSQFIFVDTPGFQTQYKNRMNAAMNRVVSHCISDVDLVLFVIEAMHFDECDQQVLNLLSDSVPVVLVINKIDRLQDKNRLLPFLDAMAKKFSFTALLPVSANNKEQLSELVETIRPFLPENPPVYDVDEITDKSERFIAAEFVREKLFRLMGDELPYSASVVTEKFVETERLYEIHVIILIDKPGQKAIIIGKNGEKLKLIGSQARKDMERVFGKKVFLRIWVKVRSGWADNVNVLRQLGHE